MPPLPLFQRHPADFPFRPEGRLLQLVWRGYVQVHLRCGLLLCPGKLTTSDDSNAASRCWKGVRTTPFTGLQPAGYTTDIGERSVPYWFCDRGVGRRLAAAPKRLHNGSFDVEVTMPTTITLKGIPDDLYARLKSAADVNHRSLNSEVIACLESVLMPRKATPAQHLAAIRAIRARLPQDGFDHAEIDALKKQGRP